MAKLYYGGGSCTIEGSGVRGVEITYKGNIEITATHPEGFTIMTAVNRIIIAPVTSLDNTLNDLFTYEGTLKITSVLVADMEGKSMPCTIKKVMDYSQLLNVKSEDFSTKSEDIKAGYKHGRKVSQTKLLQPIIENLNTGSWKMNLFLEDGSEYKGSFHIHKNSLMIMSGAKHDDDSKELFFKKQKDGKVIDKLVSTTALTTATRATPKTTTRATVAPRTTTRTGGGY